MNKLQRVRKLEVHEGLQVVESSNSADQDLC